MATRSSSDVGADADGSSSRRGGRNVRPDLPATLVGRIVDLYVDAGLSTYRIAQEIGIDRQRVNRTLHRAGVPISPRGRNRSRPLRFADDPSEAELRRLYEEERLTTPAIGRMLGIPDRRVRERLARYGIERRHRGGRDRRDRIDVAPADINDLYVTQELPADEVGGQLGVSLRIVLRAAHSHGFAVRPGGAPSLTTPNIRLIDALYRDPEVRRTLRFHRVPLVKTSGALSERFPRPVPLTPSLVTDLYIDCGLSSFQIELVTGQPSITILRTLAQVGIERTASRRPVSVPEALEGTAPDSTDPIGRRAAPGHAERILWRFGRRGLGPARLSPRPSRLVAFVGPISLAAAVARMALPGTTRGRAHHGQRPRGRRLRISPNGATPSVTYVLSYFPAGGAGWSCTIVPSTARSSPSLPGTRGSLTPQPVHLSCISSPLARVPASRNSAGVRADLRARMSLATPECETTRPSVGRVLRSLRAANTRELKASGSSAPYSSTISLAERARFGIPVASPISCPASRSSISTRFSIPSSSRISSAVSVARPSGEHTIQLVADGSAAAATRA